MDGELRSDLQELTYAHNACVGKLHQADVSLERRVQDLEATIKNMAQTIDELRALLIGQATLRKAA